MFISSVNNIKFSNGSVKKSDPTTRVSHKGTLEKYSKIFNEAYKTQFLQESWQANVNYTRYGRLISELARAINQLSNVIKADKFDKVYNAFTSGNPNNYAQVASRWYNLSKGDTKSLIETKDGFTLVGMANYGPYSKGWFNETEHEQIILEFNDPYSSRFIDFSSDIDQQIAITRPRQRDELYRGNSFNQKMQYKGLIQSGERQPSASDYAVRYDAQGNRITSFWEILGGGGG